MHRLYEERRKLEEKFEPAIEALKKYDSLAKDQIADIEENMQLLE
jgi:hypothetical protein